MRPRRRLGLWALLIALLLAIPIVTASISSPNSSDSMSIGDELSASLLQPFTDAASFGDSLLAYLVQPYIDALDFGDTLVAQLAQPYTDAVTFGDSLIAQAFQPYGDVVSVGDSLQAVLSEPYADALNLGDSLAARLFTPYEDAIGFGDSIVAMLSQPYTDGVNFGDAIAAEVFQPYTDAMSIGDSLFGQLLQPFTDTVAIGDQLSTMLTSAMNLALADAVQVGDQISTGLLTPFNDALTIADQVTTTLLSVFRQPVVDVVAVSDKASTAMVAVSGVPNGEVTTNSAGDTIISGMSSSGSLVTQVSLPPGTALAASVGVTYTTSGANSMTQVSGVTVPYPPGKVVTVLNTQGVSSVCIVDSPGGVNLQDAVCGATDLASSHVILPCDGAAHTYSPFPSGPQSRTYTCTETVQGGLSYLQVSGLAFSSTIVDGAPPVLNLPSDITTVLTGPSGAVVSFTVSASDPLDPSPAVACSARSGAVFPVGTTTVTCTATDAAGNKATGSFLISVVYRFGGFLPPLQSGGQYHIGDTIPVRFQLTDARGSPVSFATARITAGPVSGSFRFAHGYYEFELDTKGFAAGPLTVTASLDDGTSHSITVDLTNHYVTTLALVCSPSSVVVGGGTHCQATVNPVGGPPPTGAVTFTSSDSHGTFGRVSCSNDFFGAALTCSVDYSSPSPGDQTITAAYPGDSHDLPSSATFALTVTLIPTATSLSCTPSTVQPGRSTQCEAVVTSQDGGQPTGSVTFTSSDSHGTFGPVTCNLQGSSEGRNSKMVCGVEYTPSSVGTQFITATYTGDASHQQSGGTFRLTVSK